MVKKADMYEVCWEMHRLYTKPKAAYISLHNPPQAPSHAAAAPSALSLGCCYLCYTDNPVFSSCQLMIGDIMMLSALAFLY